VAVAVLMAYHLGASTGIGDGRNAGLFGTAVATMGMLSNAVYILSSESSFTLFGATDRSLTLSCPSYWKQ
jgi:Na+/H+-translocating membrane pyrophosphatase